MKINIPDHGNLVGHINSEIELRRDDIDRLWEEVQGLDRLRLRAMNEELQAMIDPDVVFQMPGKVAGRDVMHLFKMQRWSCRSHGERDHTTHKVEITKLTKLTSADRQGYNFQEVDERFTHRRAYTGSYHSIKAGTSIDVIGKIVERGESSKGATVYQVEFDDV